MHTEAGMQERNVDVAIIGAGTAGLAALATARRSTDNVLLIEAGPFGTTCARVGCMPSKLLIAAAERAEDVRNAAVFGIEVAGVAVDGAAVMRRLRTLRDDFVEAVVEDVAELPAAIRLEGRARFLADDRLEVATAEGQVTVRARRIVVATGSSPTLPAPFDGIAADTSDTVFDWADLPASVAVFGNGIIGLELGQALARLGVAVRLYGKDGLVGPLTDPDILGPARAHLAATMDFVPHHDLTAIQPDGAGFRVEASADGVPVGGHFSRVLVAIGRAPNLAGLDLANTSLRCDADGVPSFDRETGRCGETSIYIAGDAMDDRMVLHEAATTGEIAGANAAGRVLQSFDREVPLAVVFTAPQIALVGETRAALDARGAAYVVGTVDWCGQGRARIMDVAAGRLDVFAEAGSGLLLGAEMFGPRAEHLAHMLAAAMAQGQSVDDMLQMPFYHPTFEEGLRTALRDARECLADAPAGEGAAA